MTIKIYNTMTRQKEVFVPLQEKELKMYTCGPTVYNYIHIGNARMAVFFDVVRRFFEEEGYKVSYVQNVTDVDDKIIGAAKEQGVEEQAISSFYTKAYNEDLEQLHVKRPSVQPKVTEHVPNIIAFIESLIQKGYAYEVNGDVYYRVEKFKEYGKLSNQLVENLQHTTREVVEIIDYKENDHDFALWKAQKGNEITWESPWGKGRPGWHIECSVMSMNYLGETIDIHAGGMDLCFPHHENEIAQSEAHSGKPFANYWMHNNYITVDGAKMSKSVGNFTTVKDALKEYDGDVIRYFFLTVNYRNTLDYSKVALHQANNELTKLRETIDNVHFLYDENKKHGVQLFVGKETEDIKVKFRNYMQNDFDTSNALTTIIEYAKVVNVWIEKENLNTDDIKLIMGSFKTFGRIIGIPLEPSKNEIDASIEQMIEEREGLKRKAKETKVKEERIAYFNQADAIRTQLESQGIKLEDTANGARWKKV